MAALIWTEPALHDLDATADYIALEDPPAAARLVQRVFQHVQQLAAQPESGSRPPELRRSRYRQIVSRPAVFSIVTTARESSCSTSCAARCASESPDSTSATGAAEKPDPLPSAAWITPTPSPGSTPRNSPASSSGWKPLPPVARLDFGPRRRRAGSSTSPGTNGKGSVCAMLDAVCRAQGYRTGLFTSPHLVSFRERIRLDGRPIPEAAVAARPDPPARH